jgi:hypothetical protein
MLTRGIGGGTSSSGLFLAAASMGDILSWGDPGSLIIVCLTANGDTHCCLGSAAGTGATRFLGRARISP